MTSRFVRHQFLYRRENSTSRSYSELSVQETPRYCRLRFRSGTITLGTLTLLFNSMTELGFSYHYRTYAAGRDRVVGTGWKFLVSNSVGGKKFSKKKVLLFFPIDPKNTFIMCIITTTCFGPFYRPSPALKFM